MPSPAYLLRDLFTVDELKAAIKDLLMNGRFTSLSAGAKTSGIEYMPFDQQMIELRAELNRLLGTTPPQKVEQRLYPYDTNVA
ncbi:MAG: hypothetical protein EBW84_02765 [Betaproteobacteria bacterium]|nr:hypothetical protein [Betaproteobacteria bacterium]